MTASLMVSTKLKDRHRTGLTWDGWRLRLYDGRYSRFGGGISSWFACGTCRGTLGCREFLGRWGWYRGWFFRWLLRHGEMLTFKLNTIICCYNDITRAFLTTGVAGWSVGSRVGCDVAEIMFTDENCVILLFNEQIHTFYILTKGVGSFVG